MPELPEVETIRMALRQGGRNGPALLGRTILSAGLLWDRSLSEPSPAEFSARIAGQSFQDFGRRGKFIVAQLTKDTLLVHLRMSGDLRVEPDCDDQGHSLPLLAHDRVVFYCDDNLRLAFNDTRKFGRIWLTSDPQTVLGGLGPEPLADDFTAEGFFQRLQKNHRLLKPLLLDQSFLAGLGNIYTDEALHLAGIHPCQSSDQLTMDQARRLWQAIREVLLSGISHNGASFDWVYRGGNFQNTFRVYGRAGKPCPVCGHPIERRLVGQRGTHFCPICQPAVFKVSGEV
jgi:formamidopyrimidine-DNA glycosylase (fpg)